LIVDERKYSFCSARFRHDVDAVGRHLLVRLQANEFLDLLDSLLPMLRRLCDKPSSGEFVAQRNNGFSTS
jgi:hypothetical protein